MARIRIFLIFALAAMSCGDTTPAAKSDAAVCEPGFSSDGTDCVNDDECVGDGSGHNCDIHATCTDTDGSFSCACNSGYTGDGMSCFSGISPRIYDFSIEPTESNANRIYFKSSKSITASTVTGFYLGDGKRAKITGVTINPGQLDGHFFTVDTDLNFWDIYALRYEGGDDWTDLDSNPMHPMWLHEVVNNIPEPAPSGTPYWVRTTGNDSSDGLSHATAFRSIQTALDLNASTIYIEAGDYGNQQIHVTYAGTAENPTVIQGYKDYISGNAPVDLPDNYWSREVNGNAVDTSEMPTITGTDAIRDVQGTGDSAYHGIITGTYLILKNIQVRKYFLCINANSSHKLIKNVNLTDCSARSGSWAWGGIYDYAGNQYGDNHSKYVNINITDTRAGHLTIYGSVNLIDNVRSYSDRLTVSPDYPIGMRNGSNSIIKNSYISRSGSRAGSHHGYSFRSGDYGALNETAEVQCEYNLLTDSHSSGSQAGIELRHAHVYNNVVRNMLIDREEWDVGAFYNQDENWPAQNRRVGIVIRDNAHDNNIENVEISGIETAVYFTDTAEDEPSTQDAPYNNYFRNLIIHDVEVAFAVTGNPTMADPQNNIFENLVVYNLRLSDFPNTSYSPNLFDGTTPDWDSTNQFINMSVSGNDSETGLGDVGTATITNSNWHGQSWSLPGTNITNHPTLFVDEENRDFKLQATSLLIGAGVLGDNKYGFYGNEATPGSTNIGIDQTEH